MLTTILTILLILFVMWLIIRFLQNPHEDTPLDDSQAFTSAAASEPQPEPEAAPEPVSEPETKPDSESIVATANIPEPEPEPEPQPQPQPQPEPEPDNLKDIEGIGPKVQSVLNEAGIVTFQQLADSSIEDLQRILDDASVSRIVTPETWPEQAALCAKGDIEALEKLQDELKGGRRV